MVTTGDGSSGLSYHSIGGGGGYAGNTLANAQLGGLYRGETFAADLNLTSQVITSTSGANSSAMLVQSIGGGGGRVGNVGGNASLGGTAALLGTANAHGGSIDLTIDTSLVTTGNDSTTLRSQSIGGGGGVAGSVGGNAVLGGLGTGDRSARNMSLAIQDTVSSAGAQATSVQVQSIGGGGGSVNGVGGDITFGRSGPLPNTGDSSSGDLSLMLEQDSKVFSLGAVSPGLIAQTIGGGGGFAASTSGTVQLGAGGSGTLNADASAGGIVWTNSARGTQTVVTDEEIITSTISGIATSGDLSPAVVLQSIGGGGGYTTGGSSVSFSAAGHGGSSTAAGAITATNSGVITTSGDNSFGLLLQSLGGGGGVGGSSTGVVSLANSNANSSSGDINLTNTGTISTSGRGSHAVVAQTIAGGGGFVFGGVEKKNSESLLGNPTGSSGDINVTNRGTIRATGANAVALLFQNATGGAYLYQNPDGSVSNITEGATDGDAPAGEVVVNNTGLIIASGKGGVGITKSTSETVSYTHLTLPTKA